MLYAVDEQFAKFWHKVLVGLCKLTGLDNYLLAKATIVLGAIFSHASFLIYVSSAEHPLWFASIYILIAFDSIALLVHMRTTAVELQHKQAPDMLPSQTYMWARIKVSIVCIGTLQLIADISLGWPALFGGLGCYSYSAALYFASDYQRPSKSAVSKARDWLKTHISLGGLSPMPT